MSSRKESLLRKIPPVDTYLQDPDLLRLADQIPYAMRRDAVRVAVGQLRSQLLDDMPEDIDQATVHRTVVAEAVHESPVEFLERLCQEIFAPDNLSGCLNAA